MNPTSHWTTEPSKFHDDPTCDASLLYWHRAMTSVILKSHPLRGHIDKGYLTREDVLSDGFIAVHAALNEFDESRWNTNVGAFLTIRVPMRLIDLHRSDRRARTTGAIVQAVLEVDPNHVFTDSEIVYAIGESGTWKPWLGRLDEAKIKDHRLTVQGAFEDSHLRLDAISPSGDSYSNLVEVSVKEDAEVTECGEELTRHIVGLDLELLLAPKRVQSVAEMRRLVIEQCAPQQPEPLTDREVNDLFLDASSWARERHLLESGLRWGAGFAGSLSRRTAHACPRCGLIWPLLEGASCRRSECSIGAREVPPGFTLAGWEVAAATGLRVWCLRRALKDAPKKATVAECEAHLAAIGYEADPVRGRRFSDLQVLAPDRGRVSKHPTASRPD